MKLIRGLDNIPKHHLACVATIGNFDGVHVGHQAIIEQLQQQAKTFNLPSVIIIFEPTPKEFFKGLQAPPRLSRLREKIQLLSQYQVDEVLCIHFNEDFARLPAPQFIETILVKQLNVKHLIVGDDFRFGCKRLGDFKLLQKHGAHYDMQVSATASVKINGERVSSSLIRDYLKAGNLSQAARLLGHAYTLCGRVAHGDKRGRLLGFPTANIYLHRRVSPILGVYCIKLHGIAGKCYNGVANVGSRPTFAGTRILLEVHLFDFDQEIYGAQVCVEFIHKLRDEKKYANFELLKEQIFRDASEAKAFFERY